MIPRCPNCGTDMVHSKEFDVRKETHYVCPCDEWADAAITLNENNEVIFYRVRVEDDHLIGWKNFISPDKPPLTFIRESLHRQYVFETRERKPDVKERTSGRLIKLKKWYPIVDMNNKQEYIDIYNRLMKLSLYK